VNNLCAIGKAIKHGLSVYGMTQSDLARRLGVSKTAVRSLMIGKNRLTAKRALGLEKVFGTDAGTWMYRQLCEQLEEARSE
jgi:addiction module HigA family antidote